MNINLLIKSVDIFDHNYEKSFISEKILLSDKIEYSQSDEYGESKIFVHKNFLEIFRKGQINSKQIFKLGEITNFLYLTENMKGHFSIKTNTLTILNRKIYLEYDIIDKNEVINSIKLEITEL